ncbi:MAG TPA: GNAT family N-acetyltransferase [Gemmatimonadaceae bacterium]
MRSAIEVRPMCREDLVEVTELHLLAFPRAALTSLGKEAVLRYYQWQFEHQRELYATVAVVHGRIAGFSLAGRLLHPLTGYLKDHRRYLLGATLRHPSLLANPIFRDRVMLAVKKLRPRRARSASRREGPRFGVLALAVHPDFQGYGIGQALLDDAECEARRLGVSRIGLTVRLDNDQAIRFYERQGWCRELDARGRWRGTMHKDVAPTAR